MNATVKPEPVRTGAARGKAAPAYGWPTGEFRMPTMDEWWGTQFKLLADWTQVGQEMMASASNNLHVGIGVLQRMMAARTPDDLAAGTRDLYELVSARYFDQLMKLAERMQGALVPNAAKAAKHIEEVSEMEKAA